jgi:5-methylcytosine-specific restriction enzyme subunit McrC
MVCHVFWPKAERSKRYDLDQSDFYQLFAYGQKYLDGSMDLFLVYPKTAAFPEPFSPFYFSPQMRLHVLPLIFCDVKRRTPSLTGR